MNAEVRWDEPGEGLSWEWVAEGFPGALAPLAGEALLAFYEGYNTSDARAGSPYRSECRIVNGFLYGALRPLVPESEIKKAQARSFAARRAHSRTVRRYWDETVMPALREAFQDMRAAPVETAGLAELARLWDDTWRWLPRMGEMHATTTDGAREALEELSETYESLTAGRAPARGLDLVRGLPTELQRVQSDLYRLEGLARETPAVSRAILEDPAQAPARLRESESGAAFLDALQSFLDAHGHLGTEDLTRPAWADDPTSLLVEVRKRLDSPSPDPTVRRLRLALEAERLADEVREALRERPGDLRRFETSLALAREAGPLTETHHYWLDRMGQAHLHRLIVRVGRRLAEAGVIESAHDVFFLYAREIHDALEGPCALGPLVARRRLEHDRCRALCPPRRLGAAEAPGRASLPADGALLRGLPASRGTARGPARLVRSAREFARVRPGDVLVAPVAFPSWLPLFGIVAGLVTDVGGPLSHGAVLAREFGLPAVVGTGDATARLTDGSMVEVDGTLGEVRPLVAAS